MIDVRGREQSEREFFGPYYAERRYHPTGWRLRMERDVRMLRRAAPGGRLGRVVSIGCGDGAFELLLAAHAESVLGIDLSPEAIDVARAAQRAAGARNVEFRCASISDLELDGGFDTVVALAFLHHLPADALADFSRRAARWLTPGGVFYAQDPNEHGILRRIARRVMAQRYASYHSADERELDPAGIAAVLREAGFTAIAVRYIDLTLIPVSLALVRAPDVVLQACRLVDRLWCAGPLAPWASGFCITARTPAAGAGAP